MGSPWRWAAGGSPKVGAFSAWEVELAAGREEVGSGGRFDVGGVVLALAVVVFGGLVVWQASEIRLTPAYAKVGPRVIPYIVGGGLIVIGLWLAGQAVAGKAAAEAGDAEDADPTLPTDWRTVGLLAMALLAYLFLIERAGFVLASATLYVGAAAAMGSRRVMRDVVVGVVISVLLYVGFTMGLGLDLPEGVLAGLT